MPAAAVLAAVLTLGASSAHAATPGPPSNPDIVLRATPLLSGVVAPGEWVAVRVDVQNLGPTVIGELRLTPTVAGGSTYSIDVELPNGAHQQHYLYVQAGIFGSRFDVSLVSGDTVHARVKLAVDADPNVAHRVYIVAEHPERLTDPLGDALQTRGIADAKVVVIGADDLPPRAEAWSSMELLVWHDVSFSSLDAERLEALQTWLALGGDLVFVAGSLGPQMFGGVPPDLLPFAPTSTLDLQPSDVSAMLGVLPAGASALPALSGELLRGIPIWRSQTSGAVVGARQGYGQGTITLLGINPLTGWLAGSAAEDSFWERAVPASTSWSDPRLPTDDQFLVSSLSQLPAVQLPGGNQLVLLILGYVLAIGPLNYIVLRRLDRREWAWLTMPLTILAFGVAAYGIGVVLKGGRVIVNELAVVAGAAGSDRGVADVHVGVFSPGRDTFDVSIGPASLVSVSAQGDGGRVERPLDVVMGESTRLRSFGVGYGAMRAFRAQAGVPVPRIDAELALIGNNLNGTITNSSSTALEDVTVVYGGTARLLGDMAPGASLALNMQPRERDQFDGPLSWQVYPFEGGDDPARTREIAVRRALFQHLDGGWDEGQRPSQVFSHGPVILAWLDGGRLEISTGAGVERVGATVFVLPADVAVTGHVVFSGGLLEPTVEAIDSDEGFKDGNFYSLGRGTLTVHYRPIGFDGTFTASALSLRVALEPPGVPSAAGKELVPLPPDEQPDPDSPLATSPRPAESPDAPRLQLLDQVANSWVEFEPITMGTGYTIGEPQRYVDAAGVFHIRFVVRNKDFLQFAMSARLEGDIE